MRIATAADAGADRDVRLQAAIHAARLVPRHWTPNPEGGEKDSSPGIPTDQKPQVRNHLVQSALEESDPKVRHQLARLIAEIAELDAPQNEWPDLVPGVLRLAESSESAAHREMATFVLHSLLENDADSFKELVPQILALLAKTLRDPESADVRVNSMLAAGSIVLLLDENEEEDAGKDEASREALRGLVPDMVEVLRAAIDADDDDKMRSAFEVLQTFLMVDSALLSTAYLKELMTYMADVAGDANRSTDARNQALSFLCQCVRYRRMKIQGMRDMGSALTVRALQVLTELDADEEEVDESTPPAYALELLGELADNLPPRQVCVAVLDKLPALAKHENPAYREAAVLALGKTAEGGPDFVTTQLKTIMPIVLALLNDANVMVRLYSLDALVQMADSIHTELAPYHAPLIEGVAKNIEFARTAAQSGQVDEKVATRLLSACCRSIDAMSGAFEDETLEKYAPALIEQMRDMMSAPAHRIKAAAAGALGAIAVAMGDKFRPYFEATMAALSPYVAIKETEDDMTLRAQVCDSIGRIATAAGRELMQPYVRDLMAASEEGLKLDFARLRETSFLLWGTLAEVYETDFGVFLEGVMKALFEALEESEVDLEEKVDDALNAAINKSKKASGADDDDDDDDDDESAIALVDWTEAQEQAVAAQALGDVLVHACTKEDLTRYLEKAVELVSGMVNNQYEDCRHAAIGVLWRAYARVWQIWEEETGIKWAPGFPPRDKQGNLIELSPVISKLGFVTTQATLSIWGEEPDR